MAYSLTMTLLSCNTECMSTIVSYACAILETCIVATKELLAHFHDLGLIDSKAHPFPLFLTYV